MAEENQEIKYLVFDIESIPDAQLIKDVKYPKEDLTDEQAIEKLQNEILEITAGKSNFIPVTFQLPLCVVVAKVDTQFNLVEVVSLDEPEFRAPDMARKFFLGIEELYPKSAIVTFNGRGFDVPLLELIAYRYGFSAKRHFNDKFGTRPRYGSRHIDLQEFMSNFHNIKMAGGLNLLAKVLGMPGKMDTDGSEVYDMYKAGKINDINDYCICDVLDTYFVFLRTRVLAGKITKEKEYEIVQKTRSFLEKNTDNRQVFKKYLDNMKDVSPYI